MQLFPNGWYLLFYSLWFSHDVLFGEVNRRRGHHSINKECCHSVPQRAFLLPWAVCMSSACGHCARLRCKYLLLESQLEKAKQKKTHWHFESWIHRRCCLQCAENIRSKQPEQAGCQAISLWEKEEDWAVLLGLSPAQQLLSEFDYAHPALGDLH